MLGCLRIGVGQRGKAPHGEGMALRAQISVSTCPHDEHLAECEQEDFKQKFDHQVVRIGSYGKNFLYCIGYDFDIGLGLNRGAV